jgi:L-ascorbate metabolism protein UlaG (beta-lactamase superfamily)
VSTESHFVDTLARHVDGVDTSEPSSRAGSSAVCAIVAGMTERGPGAQINLTLIGGPTLLIELGGLRLLTDPTFDAPQAYEGAVRLVKRTGPALSARETLPIDAVLLSHDQHADNLDNEGRALLPWAGRVFTTPAGASRLGGHAEGLDPWQSATLKTPSGDVLRVTATPARHGPRGFEPISGDVTGFVLTLEGADGSRGPGVYVSGDTVWYEGVAETARRFDIGLAILFTGAARPRGAFHVTMNVNDAVEAAHAFSDATIVAIHKEGWEHFSESQEDVSLLFAALGLTPRLQQLQRGVRISVAL